MPTRPTTDIDTAIIGSGFAGLGAAIRLKQEGVEDFVVFERADEVGGVWRANRYPGCACDTASHLYSFSFAPKPDWSRRFAKRDEILAYLKQCATDFGVRPHLRFGHRVERAAWDDEARRWMVDTSHGRFAARVLVSGVGAHSEPRVPDLPGQERFAGRAFHSSHWPADFDPSGQRVAVVGTGASAVQLVPALQPVVEHLTLFQRTAPWVVPHGDGLISGRIQRLFARFPQLLRAWRYVLHAIREASGMMFWYPSVARLVEYLVRFHLRRQVQDPALRDVLTPDYLLGCKRILHSDHYYPALTQPNVTVVDGAAQAVHPDAVSGPEDGTAPHTADALIYCTGFHSTEMPFARSVYGRDGTSLHAYWGGSPRAYLGATVTGFPNLFLLRGPNTGLGHNAILPMIEAQIEHLLGALQFMDASGAAAVEPHAAAQARFVREVDQMAEGTVWTSGGCDSWYLDGSGRNAVLWPGSVRAFHQRVVGFDPAAYRTIRPRVAPREELVSR
jgi:cation diffusion facilitator CzcD-associated flavoprotein CzcO